MAYEIVKWETPATGYPVPSRAGNFRLTRHRYPRGYYPMSGLRDTALWQASKAVTVTALQEKRGSQWRDWMVDDPPHWEAMKFYASQAHGNVLCGGLGLGLVQSALTHQPGITSLVTVDRSPEVRDLVWDYTPNGSGRLVTGDFMEYVENLAWNGGDPEPDFIIVDLWVANGLEEKVRLMVTEVVPMQARLRELFPSATLVFHGFVSQCDVKWPMSPATRDQITMLAEAREG